jgi:hypothetical protein
LVAAKAIASLSPSTEWKRALDFSITSRALNDRDRITEACYGLKEGREDVNFEAINCWHFVSTNLPRLNHQEI